MIRLEEIRKSRKISQQEIAEIINVDQSKISRIERQRGNLNDQEIIKLCKALNCSADYLLGLIEIKENK